MSNIIALLVTFTALTITTSASALVDDPVGLMATVALYQTQCVSKGLGPPVPQATWSHLKTVLTAHGIRAEDAKFAAQVALRVLQDPELGSLLTESNNEALKHKCQELEGVISAKH
jgi:hypothetical protein